MVEFKTFGPYTFGNNAEGRESLDRVLNSLMKGAGWECFAMTSEFKLWPNNFNYLLHCRQTS